MAIHTIDGKTVSPDVKIGDQSQGVVNTMPVNEGNVNNVPQILVGRQTDGFGTGIDYGIKVSQQGIDVRTATNDQLVMSSAFNMFKIVGVYTLDIYHDGTSGTSQFASITHNLGYVPAIVPYVGANGTGFYNPLPYIAAYGYSATPGVGLTISRIAFCEVVTSTYMQFNVIVSGGAATARTYNFKVFAFKETMS